VSSAVRGALLALVAVAASAAPARAQAETQAPDSVDAAKLTLVFEREVFTYSGENRRDPFRPLTDQDDMGPRFEALALQGIIYSTGRGRSVALLGDSDGRIHRVRVGDVVGNSRVIEIGPMRVVLAVENFGTIRQEILELPIRGGTDR
jgi:Tfp pilus assembly protein PilP